MRRRRAFTLMESALVLFLMGFLSVTAVASFNGWRTQSADREAQGAADAALDALVQVALSDGEVSAALGRLVEEESRLNWLAGDVEPVNKSDVSVAASSRFQRVAVAVRSTDGVCWLARHSLMGPVSESPRMFAVMEDGSNLDCTAETALDAITADKSRGESWRRPVLLG